MSKHGCPYYIAIASFDNTISAKIFRSSVVYPPSLFHNGQKYVPHRWRKYAGILVEKNNPHIEQF